MRGASVKVAAATLLLALIATSPAHARSHMQCAKGASCPDLTIRVLGGPTLSADQRSVTIQVEVENQGTGDALQGTTVQATAPGSAGWASSPVDVHPLKASGGLWDGSVSLTVPDSMRGKQQGFLVTVDPNDTVDELAEDNNSAPTDATFIPIGDLEVTVTGHAFRDGGRTLVVNTNVSNIGKGVTAATSVEAPGASWNASAPVPSLEPGASTPVDVAVPIPDNARGQTVQVTATVDPAQNVAEMDYTNNSSTPFGVQLDAGDLTAAIVNAHPSADWKQLTLSVRVTNAGTAPTAATSVNAGNGIWKPGTAEVPSLDGGASTTVRIPLTVPPQAAGTTTSFVATVDPDGDVAESNPNNNQSAPVKVTVPSPQTPPNLTVRIVSHTIRGDPTLTVVLEVHNSGDQPSHATTVSLSTTDSPHLSGSAPVRSIPGHSNRRTRITVPFSTALLGTTPQIVVQVDPRHDILESSYKDNRAALAVSLPPASAPPSSPASWPTWLAIGSVLVLTVIGVCFGLFRRRVSIRVRWQDEAGDDEPPKTCQVPQSYVWRKKCKPKPALRSIEHVVLVREQNGGEFEREVDHEISDGLNRALRAHRLRRSDQSVHQLLRPLADGLAHDAEEWLDDGWPETVRVRAHLKGSKLEWEFKRYECVRRGPTCSWQERQSWTAELEDEADEPITVLSLPLPKDREEHSRSLAVLERDLRAFVQRVDHPGQEQPPRDRPDFALGQTPRLSATTPPTRRHVPCGRWRG